MDKTERKTEKLRLALAVAEARARVEEARRKHDETRAALVEARERVASSPRRSFERKDAADRISWLLSAWRIALVDARSAERALREALAAARAFRFKCEQEDNTF